MKREKIMIGRRKRMRRRKWSMSMMSERRIMRRKKKSWREIGRGGVGIGGERG